LNDDEEIGKSPTFAKEVQKGTDERKGEYISKSPLITNLKNKSRILEGQNFP
jgi:hypothetical protein